MSKYTYHPKDQAYIEKHKLRGINYYDDLLQKSAELGCDNVVDGIKEAYLITRSTRKAGALLGRSEWCISTHLKLMGVELLPPGGSHRPKPPTRIGAPCKYGHTERYVDRNDCRQCCIDKAKRYYERIKQSRG